MMTPKSLVALTCFFFATAGHAAEDITFVADIDGSEQQYVQLLPPEFDAKEPVDILIALHGHGSDRWQFVLQDRDECRAVRDVARQRKMILISPDYRATTSWMGPKAEADTMQIIARLKTEFRVRKVILCGASMGGASCLTFAALHPELVDGVASMNGTANHVEYDNFQDAIRQSFGGTKTDIPDEYRKRSAELWPMRFTMPSAFTVGGKDKTVPPGSVLRLARKLQQDGRDTLLINRENGGHSTAYDDAVAILTFVLNHADTSAATGDQGGLRLTLPNRFYAVAGTEISIYFDNIVLTQTPQNYRFDMQCELGRTEKRRWTVKPSPDDVGTYELNVTVSDQGGVEVGQAQTQLHVVPAQSGKDRNISMLIVGDSLTHATTYPNELARLISQPGNPEWKMLGTHRPKNAAKGVRHEGYGGWTWQRFVTKYEPNPDGTHRKRSSPFVFLDTTGKPQLNVARYFDDATNGERPDVVFFLLGINDCFGADPDDLAATDARIDVMLKHAETLLQAFRKAAPKADLAICITTPPNSRESGFEANYKGRYHRWGWKRIQQRLVERLTNHFITTFKQTDLPATSGRVYVVPTQLNLDPIDGYPDNNGVHPNAVGYQQIGTSLYCWLKWWMTEQAQP